MKSSHTKAAESRILSGIEELLETLRASDERSEAIVDFEDFENNLHEAIMRAETEILERELSRLDLHVPAIVVDGVLYLYSHSKIKKCFDRAWSLLAATYKTSIQMPEKVIAFRAKSS